MDKDKKLDRYNPQKGAMSLRDAMSQLFDESFWDPFEGSDGNVNYPKVDISETDKEVKVFANVAGVNPDDIDIEVNNDILSIKGQINEEKEDDEDFYRYEREFGQFNRSFSLPVRVDEDAVQAELKDGVLSIVLPKVEDKSKKKIKINKS